MGILGGVRAQYQLRQMMVSMDVHFVNKPEVMIAQAHEKFSELGELNDSQTAEFIEKLMLALTDWTRRLQR
ncbi:MAG: NADPH-dependent FMN reductase, partial [Oceanisphaera sp.]